MPPEERSKIEELKKSLYSRNAPDVRTRRRLRLEEVSDTVKNDWEHPIKTDKEEDFEDQEKKYEKLPMSFLVKILIGSFIFCLVAVGIGAYLFFNGANLISANNVDIQISGPVSLPGGSPVTFDIDITNKNSVDLQMVDLAVEFPEGAANPDNPTQELSTYRELVGNISSGANTKKTVKAIIFGEQNSQKSVKVSVTYQVKGSISSFTKEKTYDILINSSPVNLTVSSFKEITSGQEFDLKINVKSNSTETLKSILVSAVYPFGFTYISSSLKPLPDNATWRLGDMPPGGERTIIVHGKMQGENEDVRVFHASVGAQSSKNQNTIGTEYMSASQEIALKKSFMTIDMSINDSKGSEDGIGSFNQPSRVEISWFNNLPSAITNTEISVKLSGSAYDRTLVQPMNGYFRSSTDEIVWNSQTTSQLGTVGAGEEGSIYFNITPKEGSLSGKGVVNPFINLKVNVKGTRTQESGVPQDLSSIVSRNLKISSDITLSGRIIRASQPFENTGPIPPQVDKKTTYTIVWSIDNTVNTVNNVRVTAKLPQYVKWLSIVSPENEDVTYDEKTGIVTWNAGSIGTYTANSGERRTVYFQVSLEPSVNQVGTAPNLIESATLTGSDDYTGATVNNNQSYLTTRFSTDPSYKEGNETVVR